MSTVSKLGGDVIADARREFYALAGAAIREGRLTPAEVATIARVGHRKQNYWGRHLRDLHELLVERRDAKQSAVAGESP